MAKKKHICPHCNREAENWTALVFHLEGLGIPTNLPIVPTAE